MGLILDTGILIAAERHRLDLPALLRHHSTDTIHLAAITASELLHGVERANTPERRARRQGFVESVLRQIPLIDFGIAEARSHALLWAGMEQTGQIIGPHDLLIAATALAGGHRLATLNEREFRRVPGLVLAEATAFSSE